MYARPMSRKDFDALVNLCLQYDEYLFYIEDYNRFIQVQNNNINIEKEFTEIMSQYTKEHAKGFVPFTNCTKEECSKKLTKYLYSLGIEVV